jgi:hypothetical protein
MIKQKILNTIFLRNENIFIQFTVAALYTYAHLQNFVMHLVFRSSFRRQLVKWAGTFDKS